MAVYEQYSIISIATTRYINSSLGKLKIPIFEASVELQEGDVLNGNSGMSDILPFESIVLAYWIGEYGAPLIRYAPTPLWYGTPETNVTYEINRDDRFECVIHFSTGTLTATIANNDTNAVGVSPIFALLHSGNEYLPIWGPVYFNKRSPEEYIKAITEPSADRPGYVTYYGPLRGGYTIFGFGWSRVTQGLFEIGRNVYAQTEEISTDPYAPEGESEGQVGGDGTHEEEESDPIPIPPEPRLSAANTNFIRLYNPTLEELQSLANYMWSDLFDLNSFKKIFSDPISCILGLSIVPVEVRNGGYSSVIIGNVDTEVQMNRAFSQYETVNCGSLTVSEYWGAYLDYSPYTKFELYLPYIGIRPLSADDIMGKTISVTYRVDILSGSCVAYVKCDDSVLYTFIGQCSSSIPITGNDWTNVINGALNIAGAVGTLVATGGFSAPAQIAGTAAGTAYQAKNLMSTGASLVQNVMSMKPQIEKSGSLSGTGGLLGIQKPYLIITRPKQALPARQNYYMGYPSFVTVRLGDISGYTEIDAIHLDNIPATSDELDEIERLLKGGVIL